MGLRRNVVVITSIDKILEVAGCLLDSRLRWIVIVIASIQINKILEVAEVLVDCRVRSNVARCRCHYGGRRPSLVQPFACCSEFKGC